MCSLRFFLCVCVVGTLIVGTYAQFRDNLFTSGLQQCLPSTTEVNQDAYNRCLLREIKKVQPQLAAGVPELQIPSLDPLFLDNLQFKRVEPPVTIDAVFSNVRVTGIKDMDIKFLDVNIFNEKKSMSMGLTIPSMLMRGQYAIGGNIFLLPIEGNGNFISKLDTVIVEGSANIVPSGTGIKTTTDNVKVGFKIKSMATKMDNLFEGNQVLSDTIHHFLNQNAQLVLDEIRPALTETLNSMIAGLFTAIFDAAPTGLHQHAQVLDTAISNRARTGTISAGPPRAFRNSGAVRRPHHAGR